MRGRLNRRPSEDVLAPLRSYEDSNRPRSRVTRCALFGRSSSSPRLAARGRDKIWGYYSEARPAAQRAVFAFAWGLVCGPCRPMFGGCMADVVGHRAAVRLGFGLRLAAAVFFGPSLVCSSYVIADSGASSRRGSDTPGRLTVSPSRSRSPVRKPSASTPIMGVVKLNPTAAPRIALTREEAARSLGMSLDSLERHVQAEVRIVRRGKLRLVPVGELQRWVDQSAEQTLL